MRELRAEQLVYDRCDCGSLWFDSHELDEYVRRNATQPRHLEGRARGERAPDSLVCPRCDAHTLAAFTVDGVPLHACDACGGHLIGDESALARRPDASSGWRLLGCLLRCLLLHPWS